ncbi:MAG: glycosyltransferase family 4 protein [Candidatus Woesearchaeota archaeon]|nr:glycosyltransferase family 4 protein [Candidatus Woesearchaeota archaeon]
MKVLMFGWEFPPNNLGGLGTACYGLTKGLSAKDVNISLVLPKKCSAHDHVNMIIADEISLKHKKVNLKYVDSLLAPYQTEKDYLHTYKELIRGNPKAGELYGKDLMHEVEKYGYKAELIAHTEDFDVIHCHDWMTFRAGIKAKKVSKKPLVVHVHATDFDRTGGNPNQRVYDLEREGMHAADKVITVSNYTKSMILDHYGVPEHKVHVVHNGVDFEEKPRHVLKNTDKVVLFLGRLTLQKGPEYFIESAKKVLAIMPDVKFVIAGTGDMYSQMIHKAAEMGLAKNILFTGHLSGDDVDLAYQMADLYVMPSVSEPFGITPLEAMKNNTPVIISRTSGVSEVLTNAIKVDFWDTDEMTNKIVSVLSYSPLHSTLVENGMRDVKKLSWDIAAGKCIDVYNQVIR